MNHPRKLALILLAAFVLVLAVAPAGHASSAPMFQQTAAATATATVTEALSLSPTATAEPVIADTGYELLFPMLIRFNTVLRLPADQVKSAKLKIFQEGVIDQMIDVPLTDTNLKILNDTASIVYFPWPLDANNAPAPFKEMYAQWTIEDKKGNISQSGNIIFDYSDQYKKWQKIEDEPVKLYSHNFTLNLKYLREQIMRAYDLLSKNTGYKGDYTFIIYDLGSEPCELNSQRANQKVVIGHKDGTTYPCDPAHAAVVYAPRGYTMIQRTTPLVEQIQDDAIKRMALDAHTALFKDAAEAPPAWFKSGMMQMYDLIGHSNALLLARDAARTNRLLDLKSLASLPIPVAKDNGTTVRNWEAQSYMLTLYLASRFGVFAPFEIARRVGDKGIFADALAAVGNGITLEALYTDYQSWLLTDAADAAIRWTPYITIPTATVPPTETDFPTITPTSSTPTDTWTPFPSITPRPSRTPTPTQPTNTPRPPGSLFTPTPGA